MSSILINAFWWGLITIVLLSLIFAGPLRTFSHAVGTGANLTEKTLKFAWFFLSRIGTCAVCVILFQHAVGKSLKWLPQSASVAVVLSTGIFLGGAYLIGRYFRKNPFRKATVRVAARALFIGFAVLLFYELKALSWTGKEIALENLENAWPTLQHYLSRSIPLFERPNYHLLLIANGFREADGLLLTVLAASTALCFLVPYRMEEIPGTCLLYTSPSPRDRQKSRMPSSA